MEILIKSAIDLLNTLLKIILKNKKYPYITSITQSGFSSKLSIEIKNLWSINIDITDIRVFSKGRFGFYNSKLDNVQFEYYEDEEFIRLCKFMFAISE